MLTIGVLTGLRPALLHRTLTAMRDKQGDVWESATRVVVHNTGDAETAAVLDMFEWDERLTLHGELLSIAEASQHLLRLAGEADNPFYMRLEDDWEATAATWIDDACALLERVGQVRLRHWEEPVLTKHRVTKKWINWQELPTGHLIAESAHFTHNPSLMYTWDAVALGGYTDEIDAARRMHEAGWASAQLVPGVFRHLGDKRKGLSLKWSK